MGSLAAIGAAAALERTATGQETGSLDEAAVQRHEARKDLARRLSEHERPKRIEKPSPASYLTTVKQSTIVTAGKVALNAASHALGLNEKTTASQDLDSEPTGPFMLLVGLPVAEELLFRGLPGLVSRSWWIGVPSTLVFGFLHNDYSKPFSIPVTQMIGGGVYWHFMAARGLDHAIVSHITNNVLLVVPYLLMQPTIVPKSPQ